MVTMEQIKKELANIRYYYSRTHVTSDMQRGASAIVNNMMQQFLITEENNGEQ